MTPPDDWAVVEEVLWAAGKSTGERHSESVAALARLREREADLEESERVHAELLRQAEARVKELEEALREIDLHYIKSTLAGRIARRVLAHEDEA